MVRREPISGDPVLRRGVNKAAANAAPAGVGNLPAATMTPASRPNRSTFFLAGIVRFADNG
jgi:hypothetical protein